MQVQVKLLVIVVRVSALCGFIVHVSVDLALRTHDYGPGVNHAFILANRRVPERRTWAPPYGTIGIPI